MPQSSMVARGSKYTHELGVFKRKKKEIAVLSHPQLMRIATNPSTTQFGRAFFFPFALAHSQLSADAGSENTIRAHSAPSG